MFLTLEIQYFVYARIATSLKWFNVDHYIYVSLLVCYYFINLVCCLFRAVISYYTCECINWNNTVKLSKIFKFPDFYKRLIFLYYVHHNLNCKFVVLLKRFQFRVLCLMLCTLNPLLAISKTKAPLLTQFTSIYCKIYSTEIKIKFSLTSQSPFWVYEISGIVKRI